MNGIAFGLALLACSVLYVAYTEFKNDNHRDSRLLAGVGSSSALASAGLYLL